MEESKFVLSYRRCCFVAALHQQELFLNNNKNLFRFKLFKDFLSNIRSGGNCCSSTGSLDRLSNTASDPTPAGPEMFPEAGRELSVSLPNCAGLHLLTDSFPGRRRSVGTIDLNRLELCCTWRAVTLTTPWEILEVCDFPWTVQLSKRRSYRPRLNLS